MSKTKTKKKPAKKNITKRVQKKTQPKISPKTNKRSAAFEKEVNKNSYITKESAFAVQSDVVIWVATDYSKFILNDFNRNPSHYKKIKAAIVKNDRARYMPILVDKNMNIVDGQNRFLACKELGKPIYFVVAQDISINDAPDINSASKNWTMTDYVQHFAKRGREPYIKMLDLAAKYGQRLSVIAQFAKSREKTRSTSDIVKQGIFEFKTGINVEDFFKHMATFQKYYSFAGKESFIRAALKLYNHKDYKAEIMEKKLRNASGIVHDQPRTDMMVDELIKLYNYRSRQPITIDKK